MKTTHSFILKLILLGISCGLASQAFAEDPDPYQKQLNRLRDEMKSFGITLDVFSENPFQTGTTLSQYYVGEKTLLLESKTFFQMKANLLKTTDEVADMQFRNKVLRGHANNILLQLSKAIRGRKDEGFGVIEPAKQKQTLEKIVEECQKNADCVARRLSQKETAVENVLVENLEAANDIFKQASYMNSIEAMSAYQLTQMIYLEVLKNQSRIALVEFRLMNEKEAALAKKISKNVALTEKERKVQLGLMNNTMNRWKKKILERKEAKAEFTKLALDLRNENQKIAADILDIRAKNPQALGALYSKDHCRGILGRRRRHWCEGQEMFQGLIAQAAVKQPLFVDDAGAPVNDSELFLPDEFFKSF